MFLIVIFGLLVLGLTIACYNASQMQSLNITKSVQIHAPKAAVYQMISQLGNYPQWSPFLARDPTQQYSVHGVDGTVGARYHWEGNKGKDLGYQEIANLTPGRLVSIKCVIQKPFSAEPTFDYVITEKDNVVEVEQQFRIESGFVDAFFMWIFGVKREMEAINEEGLALLKKACEARS